jgi:hypothetical protein
MVALPVQAQEHPYDSTAPKAQPVDSMNQPSDMNPPTSGSATGRVVSVDTTANTVTIETSTGNVVYRTDTSTRFLRDGRTVDFANLRSGDRVMVRFDGSGDSMMATRIEVQPSLQAGAGSTYGSPAGSSYNAPPTGTYGGTPSGSPESTTVAQNRNSMNDADRLPATASRLPMVGLAGLLLLAAAVVIRLGLRTIA